MSPLSWNFRIFPLEWKNVLNSVISQFFVFMILQNSTLFLFDIRSLISTKCSNLLKNFSLKTIGWSFHAKKKSLHLLAPLWVTLPKNIFQSMSVESIAKRSTSCVMDCTAGLPKWGICASPSIYLRIPHYFWSKDFSLKICIIWVFIDASGYHVCSWDKNTINV